MPYFNRFDICAAYYMYNTLWGPTPYGAKLNRLKYRPAPSEQFLEILSENAKEIYGSLVRKHQALYVAYERYARRNPNAPSWPGTNNMPGNDPHAWMKSHGILSAVESMVQE